MTMAWRSSKAAPAPQRRARRPVRQRRNDGRVVLCAFDLLELDGKDLRREPIERRKVLLNAIARQGVPVGRAAASVTVGKIRAEAHAVAAAGFPALAVSAQQKPATGPAAGVMG